MRILILLVLLTDFSKLIADDRIYNLKDTIVVTADRQIQSKSDVINSIEIINKYDIELKKQRSTPEILLSMPGVFLQKTNHGGGSPFIRGLTGQQNLILIDGIRLNNSITRSGPNQYLSTVDPFTVNRIEVLKSGGSVEYGSDAIGGVINLLTNEPIFYKENKQFFDINLLYGTSNIEKTISSRYYGSLKNFAYNLGFTYSDYGDIVAGGGIGKLTPSGYKQINGNLDLKYRFNDNFDIKSTTQFVRQSEVPLYHKVVLENYEYNYFDPQTRLLQYLKLNYNSNEDNSIFQSANFTILYNFTEEGRISKKNNSNTKRIENDKLNEIGLVSNLISKINNNWTMNTGFDLYFDKVNSSRIDFDLSKNISQSKRGLYPDNSKYNSIAIFNLHKFRFNKFIVDGGLRYNYINLFIPEKTLGDIELSPDALVWKLGFRYMLNSNHNFGFSINKAFRSPNIDDMGTLGIVDFRYEFPANDLRPEKSINYEINYRMNYSNLNFEISYFRNELSDFITRTKSKINGLDSIDGYPIFIKTNSNESLIYGIESSVNYNINQYFKAYLSISYTYGEDITKNEPFRRIPPLNGIFGVYLNLIKDLDLNIEMTFADKQDRLSSGDKSDNRIPKGGTPGWYNLNIYSQYSLNDFKFFLIIINLTDQLYKYHGSGVYMNGLAMKIGINYKLNFGI